MKSYKTSGVCSREIFFDTQDGIVTEVDFVGGCDGNRKAVAKLVKGKPVSEVVSLLKGITCGYKPTSCADQLARALEEDSL